MATMGLSWWAGLALAPTLGMQLLAASAAVTFVGSAIAAAGAGVSMLTLDRRLPDAARLTPLPEPAARMGTTAPTAASAAGAAR